VFTSRNGDVSLVRIGLFLAVLGILGMVSGYVVYGFEQASYRQPLDVTVPAGATLLGQESIGLSARRLYYESSQTPEEIVEHFNAELRQYYSSADFVSCQRNPRAPQTFPNYRTGNGVITYRFLCSFDRATVGSSQMTTIVIHPGVRNDATGENFEGKTRIEYEQVWEP
jgi:hypothetical protein